MNLEERKQLLLRNTAETIQEDEVLDALKKDEPTAYIGYAPTGEMHIGHFTTIRKIADFINAGFQFKILLADLHAELDIEKSPLELVEARTKYYKEAIQSMLRVSGVEDGYEFVRGSSYQFDEAYAKGYMRLMENSTVTRAQRAVAEVVRHSDSMQASGLLYCYMQVQDVVALDADITFSGLDQRRIYMLGRETLPKVGVEKPLTCIFAPLLSGLNGGKMSASTESSKIGVTDSTEKIKKKMNEAFCPAGETEGNGVLEYLKILIFPLLQEQDSHLTIERPEKYGGNLTYHSYEAVEKDFVSGDLHPADLKQGVGNTLADLLKPIRESVDTQTINAAYPDNV
jgi:tyrosyl-tRNA synthetase